MKALFFEETVLLEAQGYVRRPSIRNLARCPGVPNSHSWPREVRRDGETRKRGERESESEINKR